MYYQCGVEKNMHTFQQAFAARVAQGEFAVAELSRQTGIPKGQLDKLNQGRSKSTNVDDAHKILRHLKTDYEKFCHIYSDLAAEVSPAPVADDIKILQQELSNLSRENSILRNAIAKWIVAAEEGGKIEIWLPGKQ